MFVEGKHVANHLKNSSILTEKFKFYALLKQLEKSMNSGYIQSEIYRKTSEFILDTYSLNKNRQLTGFLALPNEGMWVLKNTSVEKDQGITLINNIE